MAAAAVAIDIASVRAMCLAGRLAYQACNRMQAGLHRRRSPDGLSRMHLVGHARTDPQDPVPDPGVRSTPGMPGCLAPCRPRFCFGKKSCQLPLSARAEANVASKCWVASLVLSVHGIQVGSTRLGLSSSASLLLASSHLSGAAPAKAVQGQTGTAGRVAVGKGVGLAGWVGPAGTIEDMDQCIALQSGLFLIEFVSLAPRAPFAHRPGSDWGENNQSDTRNDMTLPTLQRFQLLMNFFASPSPSCLPGCLPRCCPSISKERNTDKTLALTCAAHVVVCHSQRECSP